MLVGRIKNSLNASAYPKNYERNNAPSQTVPDQTMSIREILDRYSRGIPYLGAKVSIYEGEDDIMPDITHMDLADRQILLEAAANEIQETKDKKIAYEKAKLSKAAAKAAKREAEKALVTDVTPSPK